MATVQSLFSAWQGEIFVGAAVLVAFACGSLALSLAYYRHRRRDRRDRAVAWPLGAGLLLIVAAGLVGAYAGPAAGALGTLLALLGGLALSAAALAIWLRLPGWLALPDPRQAAALAERLERDLQACQRDEEALRQRLREIEGLLEARGAALARAEQNLERYSYSVSHDLQEPLRMMVGFSQLLQRRHAAELSEKAREFVDLSAASAQRLSAMLADLLTLSRVGRAEIGDGRVDLAQIFKQASARMAMRIAENGAVVSAGPLPDVAGDPALLSQLFEILLDNAVKFQGEMSPRVRVSAERHDGQWEIAVRDNGIGLDPKFAERIFQPFQRLHTQSEYPGTGMGLAIARAIVERHGGRLWVESAPGEGACFRFTLPG